MPDKINQPPQYTQTNIESLNVIEDWALNFNLGNVIKYIARHRRKRKPLQDLKKAQFYLNREIARLEAK